MNKRHYVDGLYFLLVKDDSGRVDEWKSEKTLREAEAKRREMEETRGYEEFTIEIKFVLAGDVGAFIASLRKPDSKTSAPPS